jgi:hypothetical protein
MDYTYLNIIVVLKIKYLCLILPTKIILCLRILSNMLLNNNKYYVTLSIIDPVADSGLIALITVFEC